MNWAEFGLLAGVLVFTLGAISTTYLVLNAERRDDRVLRLLTALHWVWAAALVTVIGGTVYGALVSPVTLLRVAETVGSFSPLLGVLYVLPVLTLALEDATL